MKNRIRFTLPILLGYCLSAQAQHLLKTECRKDALVIDYEVSLKKPAADYSMIVNPMLCGTSDTLRLQPYLVRGARNASKVHRDFILGHKGTEPPYIKASEMPATIKGHAEISLKDHPWVRHSPLSLCVLVEREGCCKVETVAMQKGSEVVYRTPFTPVFAPVADNTGKAGQLQKDNPVLAHISTYRPYDSTRILRKERGMLYVHFPLDKIELRHDFRQNASTLDRIIDITRQIKADTTSLVKKIQIIGLASVEGSIKHNRWLAGERARALKDYVQERLSLPDNLFETVNGGEAWTELRDQVNDIEFEGRNEVLRIIDTDADPDKRERLIKQYDKGRAYRYLRDNVLSDQRNSGYLRIYYDYVPDKAAATINRASDLLKQAKYAEALELLQTVRADRRAQNALGVALYMTGHEADAITCFQQAAHDGNADARKNLEQLVND